MLNISMYEYTTRKQNVDDRHVLCINYIYVDGAYYAVCTALY